MFAKVVGGVFVVSVVALLLISRQGEVNLGAPWQFPILSQKSGETNDLERWMAMNGDSPGDFERWMEPTNTVVDFATVEKLDAHLFEGEQMHRNRGGEYGEGAYILKLVLSFGRLACAQAWAITCNVSYTVHIAW